MLIKPVTFIVLTQIFNFSELKILRHETYLFKLKQQLFLQCICFGELMAICMNSSDHLYVFVRSAYAPMTGFRVRGEVRGEPSFHIFVQFTSYDLTRNYLIKQFP